MSKKPWYVLTCTDIDKDNALIFLQHELDGTPESGITWGKSGIRFGTAEGDIYFCPYSLLLAPVAITQSPQLEGTTGDCHASTH